MIAKAAGHSMKIDKCTEKATRFTVSALEATVEGVLLLFLLFASFV